MVLSQANSGRTAATSKSKDRTLSELKSASGCLLLSTCSCRGLPVASVVWAASRQGEVAVHLLLVLVLDPYILELLQPT